MIDKASACPTEIYSSGDPWHPHRCGRKAVGDHGFCRIHSPEEVARRAAKSQAKYDAECATREMERRKLRTFDDLLAALKRLLGTSACGECVELGRTPCVYCEAHAAITKAEGH